MNALRSLTVLKMPLVLTLLMALSVSVHLGSWVMEGPMEMAALKMSALPSLTVLKMPPALTLLMVFSVCACQDSMVTVKPVETNAEVAIATSHILCSRAYCILMLYT